MHVNVVNLKLSAFISYTSFSKAFGRMGVIQFDRRIANERRKVGKRSHNNGYSCTSFIYNPTLRMYNPYEMCVLPQVFPHSLIVLTAELLIHVPLLCVGPPRVPQPGVNCWTRVARGHISHHVDVPLPVGQGALVGGLTWLGWLLKMKELLMWSLLY